MKQIKVFAAIAIFLAADQISKAAAVMSLKGREGISILKTSNGCFLLSQCLLWRCLHLFILSFRMRKNTVRSAFAMFFYVPEPSAIL